MKSRLKCHPEKYVQQNPPDSGADPLTSVPNPLLQGQDEQPRAQDFEPIATSDNQVWSLLLFFAFHSQSGSVLDHSVATFGGVCHR